MREQMGVIFEQAIEQEWLLTNGRGGYASGTVSGVPTRRYHGLLIAAARPPLERWLLLANVLDRITVGEQVFELSAFEFPNSIHPHGFEHLDRFETRNDRQWPWAQFTYEHELFHFSRQIIMPRGRDEVWLRYVLEAKTPNTTKLELAPFAVMRDFHALTHAFAGGYATERVGDAVVLGVYENLARLWLDARSHDGKPVPFKAVPDWWRQFVYREESARGQEDREDWFTPGWYVAQGDGAVEVTLQAVADFSKGKTPPTMGQNAPPALLPPAWKKEQVIERLEEAADAFVVARGRPAGDTLTTIIAGYHWFGDWGRDTFIALPGLLLDTGRLKEARQVLEVFASAQQDGLMPNRFSDYGAGRDYNSVDASLWYVHAACRYLDLSQDQEAWRTFLAPACEQVVSAFERGTRFNIHMDTDGLIRCGDEFTQLTWMDAKCGNVVFTPRHGKPVEINALWYHDLCLLADRSEPALAERYRQLAQRTQQSFVPTFWNESYRCLYDVVRNGWKDLSVRPNQIFAVSLEHSMLDEQQRQSVVEVVERRLLTPYGLRSLSADHPLYHGTYIGGPFERDSTYHQGTIWAWLIGPYVEAYLRVYNFSAAAKSKMRGTLQPLIDHLDLGCIGSLSEIFDGDPPHHPRGAIAQAWSVSELLRAWRMTQ